MELDHLCRAVGTDNGVAKVNKCHENNFVSGISYLCFKTDSEKAVHSLQKQPQLQPPLPPSATLRSRGRWQQVQGLTVFTGLTVFKCQRQGYEFTVKHKNGVKPGM